MNDKDWEAKFEMLFAEDLIAVEDDFYDEDLCFSDPNDLNMIFSELEEQNLYLIHQAQELEQSLETMKTEQTHIMEKLGGEVNLHKKNRNELNDQINESQKQLKELRQRNQMSTIQSQASTTANDKNGAQADQEFNIDDLLNDLRRDITRVYKKAFDGDVELQAKQTLDILTVTTYF